MATAPKKKNRYADTVRQQQQLLVYIAPGYGEKPTEADLQPHIHCREIFTGVGSRLPYAILEVDQDALGIRIQNEFVSRRSNRQVEVWTRKLKVDEEEPESIRDRPLFWGEITTSEFVLGEGESRILRATIEPYHFGKIAEGQRCWHYRALSPLGKVLTVPMDLEFNPLIDKKICPNRIPPDDQSKQIEDPDELQDLRNPETYSIWVDPESVRAEKCKEEYFGEPQSWELHHIIDTLSKWLNDKEEPEIANPDALEVLPRDEEVPPVKNLTLRLGGRLSDYLTEILPQFGYNWYVRFDRKVTDGVPSCVPKIAIYQRGKGAKKKLRIPAWGEDLTFETADTEQLSFSFGIADITNRIVALGGWLEHEVAIELHRAWTVEEDSQLDTSTPDSHIGRKWIASESGELKGLRPESPEYPVFTFSEYESYNYNIPKRREIHDCLTLLTDDRSEGHRRPPVLQVSTDDGRNWRDIKNLDDDPDSTSEFGGWTVIPDQIGIWIRSKQIPDELKEIDPKKLRLRIVGTVRSDNRLKYEATAENSPNFRDCVRLIDFSNKYLFRQRGRNFSTINSPLTGPADEVNDFNLMNEAVDRIIKQDRGAQVTAQASCPQLLDTYQITDLLTGVKGREISFNRLRQIDDEPQLAEDTLYLQIVGIQYSNAGEQRTILHVERYDS
ncbi:hypothetical protein SH661x_000433 [Planctomicrobium sp. SH661]|uniref:hypothetical protein n=1 Tax=Planctomicrobium sp. SH661 TaxID=3448124 RepID=UPI003F5BBD5D